TFPSASRASTSVNVPPTSAPMRRPVTILPPPVPPRRVRCQVQPRDSPKPPSGPGRSGNWPAPGRGRRDMSGARSGERNRDKPSTAVGKRSRPDELPLGGQGVAEQVDRALDAHVDDVLGRVAVASLAGRQERAVVADRASEAGGGREHEVVVA